MPLMTREERLKAIAEKNAKRDARAKDISIDPFLEMEKKAREKMRGIGDYPEQLQFFLRLFVETFNFPLGDIPKSGWKHYSTWVDALNKISLLCRSSEKLAVKAFEVAKQNYAQSPFQVSSPHSVKNLIRSSVIIIDSHKDMEKLIVETKKQSENNISSNELLKILKG